MTLQLVSNLKMTFPLILAASADTGIQREKVDVVFYRTIEVHPEATDENVQDEVKHQP